MNNNNSENNSQRAKGGVFAQADIDLLKKTLDMISKAGYRIVNIDLTYVGAEPRLEKFKKDIEANLAKELDMNINDISCKATTTDGLGFEGAREGSGRLVRMENTREPDDAVTPHQRIPGS